MTKPFTESEINNIKDYFIKYFRLDEEAISEDTKEQKNEDKNSLKEAEEEKGKQKEIQEKLDDILDYIKNKAIEDVSELSDKTKTDAMMSLVVSSELDKFRLATSLKLEDVALAISIPNANILSDDDLWEEIKDELYNKAVVELKAENIKNLELENNSQDNLNSEKEEVNDNEGDEED